VPIILVLPPLERTGEVQVYWIHLLLLYHLLFPPTATGNAGYQAVALCLVHTFIPLNREEGFTTSRTVHDLLLFYHPYSPNEYAQGRSKISGSSSISLIASEYVVSKFSFAILWASSNDSATATQIPPYSKAIEFIGQR
jgi:hypothetical protein